MAHRARVRRAMLVCAVACAAWPAGALAHGPSVTARAAATRIVSHGDRRRSLPRSVVSALRRRAFARAAGAGLPESWCGTPRTSDDTAHAAFPGLGTVKLVYAYPVDRTNRFAQFAPLLQGDASVIDALVAEQSGGRRTVRFDLGTDCGSQYADIRTVALPRPASAYRDAGGAPSLGELVNDVASAVGDEASAGPRDYLIYADGLRTGGVLGTAESYTGPSAEVPGAANVNNQGGLFAAVWGLGTYTPGAGERYVEPTAATHELLHTLGAVQPSAPHASGAGHCFDEWDVMCYADGGPNNALTYTCPQRALVVAELIDCGQDDYFNPAPAEGSYLATHWNVHDSAFLGPCAELLVACGGDGIAALPPPPAEPAPASADEPIATSAAAVTRSRAGWLRRLRRGRAVGPLVAQVRIDAQHDGGLVTASIPPTAVAVPAGRWRVRVCIGTIPSFGAPTCVERATRLLRPSGLPTPPVTLGADRATGAATAVGSVRIRLRRRGRWTPWAGTGDARHPVAVSLARPT